MQYGFYLAGTATYMAHYRLNDISQDLANVNTVGYVSGRSLFRSILAQQLQGTAAAGGKAYVVYENGFLNLEKGTLRSTGNSLDFAIQGDGFFRVGTAEGEEAYTRAGNFQIDGNGNLLTQGGLPVLDDGGSPIQLPPGKVTVNTDGEIFVEGNPVARFGLVRFKNPASVERMGGVLLKTPSSNVEQANGKVLVRQGMLEGSNVNGVMAITRLVETMRSYQAMMTMVEQFDKQSEDINRRIGSIRA